jgi:polar amino acid transport system substrate-binding protein
MLQLIQHQSSGEILVEELPAPECLPEGVLVRVVNSLISAGTERTSISRAQSSLVERAIKQPQEVKKVLDSFRKDGVAATFRKVQGALDAYKPLGYSVAGVVVQSRCTEFAVGDRVACAGNKYAYHAEIITAPKNLLVRLPDNVEFEDAAYTTLGAIAMQGVRQARVELGANIVVVGLGLLGQITVQLLKAAGCRIVGMDVNEALFAAAQKCGADLTLQSSRSAVRPVDSFTRGLGADAVIITAATDSNEPAELALELVRKRGRVVIVGAVGMHLPRSPFYEKEVEFTISCSYGPGRYDPVYEEQGIDYPPGYVRWTENRNMASFLDLIAAGKIDVRSMTTHRFPITNAAKAYDLVMGKVQEPYSGIVLDYPHRTEAVSGLVATLVRAKTVRPHTKPQGAVSVGMIGAGAFAQAQILPVLKAAQARLVAVSTTTSVSAKSVAERFGFELFATNADEIIAHPEINLVVCASRHDSHARYVVQALNANNNIFVEKPLCISPVELTIIDEAVEQYGANVMVGFNRRFSAPFVQMKKFFGKRTEPMAIIYRVNAGFVPPEHWIQNPAQGGRIIGEVCHFIDCMAFLTDALPVRVSAEGVSTPNVRAGRHDTASITLKFSDGSLGTVQYFSNGSTAIDKEYCEVFCEGTTATLKNFTTLELASGKRVKSYAFNGTKGHAEGIGATLDAVKRGTAMPIPYDVLRAVTLATFAAEESLRSGQAVSLFM